MIFCDSSFWYALRVPHDDHHEAARALWKARYEPVVTSTAIVGETWTLMNTKLSHRRAVEFIDAIDASNRVSLHHMDDGLEHQAWQWLRQHDERTYSFVDATSFALMRELGITEALAFDGDFAAAGFVELRP
ncbi:MAG: PIN domain-containing protein [Solirubrobacterales bacterium]